MPYFNQAAVNKFENSTIRKMSNGAKSGNYDDYE